MKILLIFAMFALLSCSSSVSHSVLITKQQLQCLNKRKDYVKHVVEASKQTFVGMEEDISLFKTTQGMVVGYLFEQGECSTVLTQIPGGETAQAEAFIADEVKKNRGELFRTDDNVQFKYYKARQGNAEYLVAQAF